MEVKILKIKSEDAYYKDAKKLIGLRGKYNIHGIWENGWTYGEFVLPEAFTDANGDAHEVGDEITFAFVKVTTEK